MVNGGGCPEMCSWLFPCSERRRGVLRGDCGWFQPKNGLGFSDLLCRSVPCDFPRCLLRGGCDQGGDARGHAVDRHRSSVERSAVARLRICERAGGQGKGDAAVFAVDRGGWAGCSDV